ncbi:unnamed protein product [Effrenium voratum]|uniref:Uncharacterized protein n=1 Tax=Effrenium voratum TaxID=2562239 RepID=A0AA36NAV3_9DINO|nr:unnamed protein product [Effrenium voratum]
MQRAIQTWKNSEPTSRETYVKDLELELEELADRILCHRCPVVAAMPRRWHARVLCCLDVMDLTHSLVQPSQQCLQIHLQKFQELFEIESLVVKKQWRRLQARCVSANLPQVADFLSAQIAHAGSNSKAQSKQAVSGQRQSCEHG